MTDLGTLGGTFGGALGLNSRGQVIGVSNLAGDQAVDPFLWDGGRLIDLFAETAGGNFWSANAINDAGRIVGAADFSGIGGSGFGAGLWKNGNAINLGTLSGDCYSEAIAINSGSQAVGVSYACDTFDQRAFLWEDGSLIDLNTKTPPGFSLVLASAVSINERGEIGGFGLPAGCNDVDACSHAFLLIPDGGDDDETAEGTTSGSQDDVAPATQFSTSVTHDRLAPEKLAELRARSANRHRSFGIRPLKSTH